jgi:hypothetical protein
MPSMDTGAVYDAFISFIVSELMYEKPRPARPPAGVAQYEYNFTDFPGIKMSNDGLGVTKIVMVGAVGIIVGPRDVPMGRIEFRSASGVRKAYVESSDEKYMRRRLTGVVGRDHSTAPAAKAPAVVVAPPVDWMELARRVVNVVGDFHVDQNDEEAMQSKKALLDIVRSLLQLLTLRSGARGS